MKKKLNPIDPALEKLALKDLDASLAGKPSSYRSAAYAKPATPAEARQVRRLSGLAQPAFAAAIGASPATVRSWEQGQRLPDGVSSTFLRVLARHPKLIEELVGHQIANR
jgi:DNA-binding transcriptional regulator YiaG